LKIILKFVCEIKFNTSTNISRSFNNWNENYFLEFFSKNYMNFKILLPKIFVTNIIPNICIFGNILKRYPKICGKFKKYIKYLQINFYDVFGYFCSELLKKLL